VLTGLCAASKLWLNLMSRSKDNPTFYNHSIKHSDKIANCVEYNRAVYWSDFIVI